MTDERNEFALRDRLLMVQREWPKRAHARVWCPKKHHLLAVLLKTQEGWIVLSHQPNLSRYPWAGHGWEPSWADEEIRAVATVTCACHRRLWTIDLDRVRVARGDLGVWAVLAEIPSTASDETTDDDPFGPAQNR